MNVFYLEIISRTYFINGKRRIYKRHTQWATTKKNTSISVGFVNFVNSLHAHLIIVAVRRDIEAEMHTITVSWIEEDLGFVMIDNDRLTPVKVSSDDVWHLLEASKIVIFKIRFFPFVFFLWLGNAVDLRHVSEISTNFNVVTSELINIIDIKGTATATDQT